MQPLWHRLGLEELNDAWNKTSNKVDATIAAIQATPADGLVGIGIKLAAMRVGSIDQYDLEDAIEAVMEDIARLTGTDFAAIASIGDDPDEI